MLAVQRGVVRLLFLARLPHRVPRMLGGSELVLCVQVAFAVDLGGAVSGALRVVALQPAWQLCCSQRACSRGWFRNKVQPFTFPFLEGRQALCRTHIFALCRVLGT